MGRRVTKNAQRFIYDGYLQIENFELASTNSQLTTHNLQLFIWDPTEPIATRPLAWNSSTFQPFNFSTSYYTHDGNKNVSEVIAFDGDMGAHYEYAPFGAVTATFSNTSMTAYGFCEYNPIQFSSEYNDSAIGSVYYNFRHYNYRSGGWAVRDIIGYNIQDTSKNNICNHYAACDNDMISYIDSLGKRKTGRYWQKKQRRFEGLCRKIESHNTNKQSFIKNLWNFLSDFIDQRPVDPRVTFISDGLDICWANKTRGECHACCVMLGRYACDAEYGVVPIVVSADVQCESCKKAVHTGWLISKDKFIQVAPMKVSNCK